MQTKVTFTLQFYQYHEPFDLKYYYFIFFFFRFESLLKYFRYTPKKSSELDPKDFFSLWSSFASDFKDVWNREQQRIFKEKYTFSPVLLGLYF